MNRIAIALSIVVLVFVTPVVWAAEVTVVDQQGLTRASKRISPGSAVVIRVTIIPQTGATPQSMTLKSSGGSEISAQLLKDGSYQFAGVPEGRWIMHGDVRVKLKSVHIFK